MPFYEIIYETGRSSVAYYEDDAEAQRALKAHHDRAVNGEPGGPTGAPAERIKRVLVYKKHPNEYNPAATASGDVVGSEVANLVKALGDENGVVSLDALADQVRGLAHPMVAGKESSFDSNFKMKEDKELKLEGMAA